MLCRLVESRAVKCMWLVAHVNQFLKFFLSFFCIVIFIFSPRTASFCKQVKDSSKFSANTRIQFQANFCRPQKVSWMLTINRSINLYNCKNLSVYFEMFKNVIQESGNFACNWIKVNLLEFWAFLQCWSSIS